MRFLVFCQEAFRSFLCAAERGQRIQMDRKTALFKRMLEADPYCCSAKFTYFCILQKPPITIGGFCVMWK